MPRKYPIELTSSRLYGIWNSMKMRCYSNGTEAFQKYGAKGVSICDEWRNDFTAFYNWAINNGYSDELQIDRIDFTGNYEPSNCRWVTLVEQANNKSNVVKLSFNGEEHTITEWSAITGIKPLNIWQRINVLGWNIEKALTTAERIIDKTRTEADMRVMKREIRNAGKDWCCEYCKRPIKQGELHSFINISHNYSINSIRLHFACEDDYINTIEPYCGPSAKSQWEKIKQKSELRFANQKRNAK